MNPLFMLVHDKRTSRGIVRSFAAGQVMHKRMHELVQRWFKGASYPGNSHARVLVPIAIWTPIARRETRRSTLDIVLVLNQ